MTVDFWDLLKMLSCRWIMAVPMLILSGGLTPLVSSTAKPDYVSTSYIQLVPGVPAAAKPGQPAAQSRNPSAVSRDGLIGMAAAGMPTPSSADHPPHTRMVQSGLGRRWVQSRS